MWIKAVSYESEIWKLVTFVLPLSERRTLLAQRVANQFVRRDFWSVYRKPGVYVNKYHEEAIVGCYEIIEEHRPILW